MNCGLINCFWCNEAMGIAIPKRQDKKEDKYKTYFGGYEPCDKCKPKWDSEIVMIEVQDTSLGLPAIQEEYYPTGNMWIIKPETMKEGTPKVNLITKEIATEIGLYEKGEQDDI